jgi:hypothetical protein
MYTPPYKSALAPSPANLCSHVLGRSHAGRDVQLALVVPGVRVAQGRDFSVEARGVFQQPRAAGVDHHVNGVVGLGCIALIRLAQALGRNSEKSVS